MPEDVRLTKGTKENIIVSLSDRLGAITTLDGLNGQFDVRIAGASSWLIQNEPITNVGMTAYCLIDTTGSSWVSGRYELYLHFSAPPENPRVGPFDFRIDE